MKGKNAAIGCLALGGLLLLVACGGGTRWYNADRGQAAFERDAAECERFADQYARDHTASGRNRNLELYIKAYNDCLFAKGWSQVPPQQQGVSAATSDQSPSQGTFANGTLTAFGLSLPLPANSTLVRQDSGVYGPLRQTTWFFQLPEQRYLNCIVQKNVTLGFEREPFPAENPYFVYDRGRGEYAGAAELDWTLFCGRLGAGWVAGWGGYFRIDSRHRLVVTLTDSLPASASAPPPELRLSQAQYTAMEDFVHWVTRLWPQALVRSDDSAADAALSIIPEDTID